MCALTCRLVSGYSKQEPWKGTTSTNDTDTTNPDRTLFSVSPRPNSRIVTQWDFPNRSSAQGCIDSHISSQLVFQAGALLEGYRQHHRYRHNKPWQNFIFVPPGQNSIIATQWDIPNSSGAHVPIDLHISQWVFRAGTLEGFHQHQQYRHNKPWQNFFCISKAKLNIATQWDLPNSSSVQVCMDLHIRQWWVFMADETLEGCSQRHWCMFVVPLHFFQYAYHWNDVTTMTMHIKIFAY